MVNPALPGLARLHHLFGVVLEWCGWYGGAIHAFDDALRIEPGFAAAYLRKGETLGRLGRWLEASQAFAGAARLEPSSVEYQGNLVLALARAGQWSAVADAVRRLAGLRPREGELYVLLGAVLNRARRQGEALRAFRWAVRLYPAPTTKRFFLGEALLGSRGWRDALVAWREALELPGPASGDPWAQEGRSVLNVHPGRPVDDVPVARARKGGPFARLLEGLRRVPDELVQFEFQQFRARLVQEETSRFILHGYQESPPFAFPRARGWATRLRLLPDRAPRRTSVGSVVKRGTPRRVQGGRLAS
jgi:tetratricopeptide (TPR) repeat protein